MRLIFVSCLFLPSFYYLFASMHPLASPFSSAPFPIFSTIAQAGVASFYAKVFEEHMRENISPESGHVHNKAASSRKK